MAKKELDSTEVEEKTPKTSTSTKQSAKDVLYAGAKSMASSILWISLVVCILNIGIIVITIVGKNAWTPHEVKIEGESLFTVWTPPWYYIFEPIIGGISLFLLSGLSILVIPLNKTLKREQARTFGTWIWGLIIWIFSVFYVGMFFFDIIAPIINLLVALGAIPTKYSLDQKAIDICNTIMGCIPLVTILAAGILYGRVTKSYRKHYGQ